MSQQISTHLAFSKVVAALMAVALSACGGGGGVSSSSDAASGGDGGGAGAPPASSSKPAPVSLQAHLSACPLGLVINKSIACMVGLYEGKTTDTGAVCTFKYGSDGVAYYTAGGQTLSADLSLLYSPAVFDKSAAAASPSGFAINWTVGIGSGRELDVSYQAAKEPLSANGLFIKPKKAEMPGCLVENGPKATATGAESTANLLGKTWQGPQMLNGAGAVGLFSDQPGFDAGLADDGRAVIAFRQPDASGRMAVYVVQGKPGAAGEGPVWTAPEQLDAAAPLLVGNYRPRIAVSGTGHAVVSWLSERACEADAYEEKPAGKKCRYFYASRRLATDANWEAPVRLRASMPIKMQDHFARINARGDVVVAFPSFDNRFGSNSEVAAIAVRNVADAKYQALPMYGFRPYSEKPFGEGFFSSVDDAGNLFVAGKSTSFLGEVSQLRTTMALVPSLPTGKDSPVESTSGNEVFELRTSGNGFAAYTWRDGNGSRSSPRKLTVYTPASSAWLAPYDINSYTLWGNTNLVGTDNPDGEFLLYSACKLTAWKAGTWGATRDLPEYCGRDQEGGVYAYNSKGDYLGLNWAGKPGQWGYYSYGQNKMLKGAPGNGAVVAGDLVLGTAADLFGAVQTQLLLSPSGLALAVTTNNFTTLPSAANPAGVPGGAAAKLWAVYLK